MGFDAAALARILQRPGYRIVGEARPVPMASLMGDTTENVFLSTVRRIAKDNAWLAYHTHDSRKSERGFFDLVLVRPSTATKPGRLIFAELKSEKGKLSEEQATWIDICEHSLPGLEVYVWRPSDLDIIVQILL